MQRIVLLFMVVALGTCRVVAGGANSDQKKLQGTWELTSVQVGGMEIPPQDHKLLLTFKVDKIISKEGDKKAEETTYTLDETRKPKQLTVAKTAKEKEMRAIYVLAADTLKIGVSSKGPEGERPTSMDDKETVVLTLKRSKK